MSRCMPTGFDSSYCGVMRINSGKRVPVFVLRLCGIDCGVCTLRPRAMFV